MDLLMVLLMECDMENHPLLRLDVVHLHRQDVELLDQMDELQILDAQRLDDCLPLVDVRLDELGD
jgi:hypothetical protein